MTVFASDCFILKVHLVQARAAAIFFTIVLDRCPCMSCFHRSLQGISLFEVKNRDLLAYTRDLAYLMYQMSFGNSIQADPAIERLVYLRTVSSAQL